MVDRLSARVYVDGFNLYRRCLSSTPQFKWLDVLALSRRLLPDLRVDFVHYFTANIRPGPAIDPRAPARQQIYLRALRTQSDQLAIHLGKFRSDRRHYPKHPTELDPLSGIPRTVQVRKLEEKGSDVHLAARMVFEASQSMADVFVLLSNDSDQVATLKILKTEIKVKTGIIFPTESIRSAKELIKTDPDRVVNISPIDLAHSQFNDQIQDQHGVISRPAEWR